MVQKKKKTVSAVEIYGGWWSVTGMLVARAASSDGGGRLGKYKALRTEDGTTFHFQHLMPEGNSKLSISF